MSQKLVLVVTTGLQTVKTALLSTDNMDVCQKLSICTSAQLRLFEFACVRARACIATDYGLDGPGSNPGGDEIFRPPRPALGPTQPPVKWVPVLSRG